MYQNKSLLGPPRPVQNNLTHLPPHPPNKRPSEDFWEPSPAADRPSLQRAVVDVDGAVVAGRDDL